MKRVVLALVLVPFGAEAQEGKRARVEAIAEVEARRADANARPRRSDRVASPLELVFLTHLERMMGLSLLVEPISEDPVLEAQRRLEALRVEIYARLSPLKTTGFSVLAETMGASRRAFEHRAIRLELPWPLTERALTGLAAEFERAPELRAVLFVHGKDPSAELLRSSAVLEESGVPLGGRLEIEASGLSRAGATLVLVRLRPTDARDDGTTKAPGRSR